MTDAFVDAARAFAGVCAMPGYRFAVIAHPIASDDDASLRRKAEDAVRQCVGILLDEGRAP